MSDYAIILEMRKRHIGALMHLIHIILTLCTIVWVVVYMAHYWSVKLHNRRLDKQIERLYAAESERYFRRE